MRAAAIATAALVAVVAVAATAGGRTDKPAARLAGCPLFPSNNPWNQRVDRLPVAANSATLIRSIGLDSPVHADFGSGTYGGGPIGIPYKVVGKRQHKVPVTFDYADESDGHRYPIPANVPIEGGRNAGGDRHVIVVDKAACIDYELFDAHPIDGGRSWHAGSGAIFHLRSNHLRPRGWTSADAAGLPILAGLARYDEVARGAIDHALRFTAPRTRNTFVYPARHEASSDSDPSLPPMGLRIRLKASTKVGGLGPQARIVARALRRYGALLADNGSPFFFSGAPGSRWSNDDLHTLGRLRGSDFEVVDTSSLPRPGH
jgi:hypothetical protein